MGESGIFTSVRQIAGWQAKLVVTTVVAMRLAAVEGQAILAHLASHVPTKEITMFRFPILMRGLLLAGAVALISVPAAAQAGGGFYGGCFPKTHCHTPCYTPCYQPCYRPVVIYQPVVTCQPVVVQQPICQPVIQPWMFQAQQPFAQKAMVGGARPIVIQSR
jgi:hypothetical protein